MNNSVPLAKSQTRSTSLLPTAIGIGSVLFYVLFTLLPNSNSMMVKWPWVFIWQFGLMLGPISVLAQLWQNSFCKLGHRLDFLAGAWCLALVLSASFAPFPHQAFWYSWAAICNIAFLYALNSWLTDAKRVHKLLTFQGALTVVFSIQSLLSWYFQTVRPYQKTLAELRTHGIERSFDLQILTLRNWHPIGHQNYVAGYLLLSIPLLIGLAASQKGWRRFCWIGGVVLSLATLYSTASRGSWFGLMTSLIVFVGFSAWLYPRLRKILSGGGFIGFSVMLVWGVKSDRLRNLFTSLLDADPTSDIAYRLVTNATGWNIGLDHPLFGAGPGSITLLYQKYRPDWAGQTAELTYQLHSTPAQLWAELGATGALLTLASLLSLTYLSLRWAIKFQGNGSNYQERIETSQGLSKVLRSASPKQLAQTSPVIIIGIISAIAGYSIYAITDYQLDNICLSGTLIFFTAVLFFENRKNSVPNRILENNKHQVRRAFSKRLTLAGSSLLVAVIFCLYPIHRAWMLSSQGFLALQQKDVDNFVVYLEKAHKLVPWEPYYPYQLGWNLGELAFQSKDNRRQELLRRAAVRWFEEAISLSPNREFGYSNLGWLRVNSTPTIATQDFKSAAQLVPSKRHAFFALGYSLLKENNQELAIQSMVAELLNQPILLTSPIWKTPELSIFYPQILKSLEKALNQQLEKTKTQFEISNIYQIIGSLNWWKGDFEAANAALGYTLPNPLNSTMLSLFDARPNEQLKISLEKNTVAAQVIEAWHQSSNAKDIFPKLFVEQLGKETSPSSHLEALSSDFLLSLSTELTFHQWLTQNPVVRSSRNQRLGFNVISRHIDGPIPSDFSSKISNVIASNAFSPFFTFQMNKSPANMADLSTMKKRLID